MKFKFKLTLLLLMLLSISFYAQDSYLIKGVVSSDADKSPLPGVSVIILNTVKGTDTDFDGNFSLQVKKGDVLQFSSVGFTSKLVTVTGQQSLNVSLVEDANVLDEIVVVGYGTQKSKNLTNAVTKVSSDVLEKSVAPRIDDALRGQVAGVNISTTETEVGADTRITIRGTGSISGASAPLIVVDGLPLGTDPDLFSSIDPNSIESVQVLKDASSTAIYGSRGANGVIIVELKEGLSGRTRFSYNTYVGVRYTTKNDNFNLSISEEESRIDNLFNNANLSGATESQISDFGADYLTTKSELQAHKFIASANGGETDWQDYIFTGGIVNSHSFAARGGSELTKFDATISYLKDEGIFIDDVFERYNARVKVTSSTKNKKIKFGATVNARYTDQERLPARFTDALRQGSWLPQRLTEETLAFVNPFPQGIAGGSDAFYDGSTSVSFSDLGVGTIAFERAFDGYFQADGNGGIVVDANGIPVAHPEYEGLTIGSTGNNGPVGYFEERGRTKDQFTGFGSAFLEFKLLKGLKFKQTLSGNYRTTNNTRFQSYLADEDRVDESFREDQVTTRSQLNVESLLTYNRDFGKHNVSGLAGFTYDKWNYTFRNISVQGQFPDDFTSNISLADTQNGPEVFTLLGEEKLVSYFGKLNYNYDDKYLFGVSARTDGSSRFGSDNRYGFFPSASVGWSVSEEEFLADSDILSFLKLRLSYGISGSNEIDSNIFESLYRSQALASTVSYDGLTGRKITNLGDQSLGWEQVGELNFGVDFDLFKGALRGSFDLYDKKSRDLILDLQVPTVLGANTQLQNIGQVQNKGAEFELSSRIISNDNFSWKASGNVAANRNEVLKLGDQDSFITTSTASRRPVQWITQVGGPISAFYGYVYDGEVPEYVYDPFARYGLKSQEVLVKDINGDGIIDEDDKTVLGSPYPDFEWGLTNNFNLYDFDLSISLRGSHGAERRVGDLGLFQFSDDGSASITNADYLANNFLAERNETSNHIQDASFIALSSVGIGYTLPSDVLEKMGVDKLRLYLTGENLLYFFADGYEGFNPEAAGQTSDGTNTPVTYGYQRGDGPVTRTISVGLNLDF